VESGDVPADKERRNPNGIIYDRPSKFLEVYGESGQCLSEALFVLPLGCCLLRRWELSTMAWLLRLRWDGYVSALIPIRTVITDSHQDNWNS